MTSFPSRLLKWGERRVSGLDFDQLRLSNSPTPKIMLSDSEVASASGIFNLPTHQSIFQLDPILSGFSSGSVLL
jgi:hypothetical protein